MLSVTHRTQTHFIKLNENVALNTEVVWAKIHYLWYYHTDEKNPIFLTLRKKISYLITAWSDTEGINVINIHYS